MNKLCFVSLKVETAILHLSHESFSDDQSESVRQNLGYCIHILALQFHQVANIDGSKRFCKSSPKLLDDLIGELNRAVKPPRADDPKDVDRHVHQLRRVVMSKRRERQLELLDVELPAHRSEINESEALAEEFRDEVQQTERKSAVAGVLYLTQLEVGHCGFCQIAVLFQSL